MKAEELQIGDWIFCDKKPYRLVNIINTESNIMDVEDDNGFMSYYISRAKPIPITPEILEKNGFKYNKKYDAYTIVLKGGEDLVYYIGQRSLYLFILHDDKHDWDEELHIYMEYVHEIQHALRLMKINKKIVL